MIALFTEVSAIDFEDYELCTVVFTVSEEDLTNWPFIITCSNQKKMKTGTLPLKDPDFPVCNPPSLLGLMTNLHYLYLYGHLYKLLKNPISQHSQSLKMLSAFKLIDI